MVGGCSMIVDYVSYKNRLVANGMKRYHTLSASNEKVEMKWETTEPFVTMPQLVADHYNMKLIDHSLSGVGNKQIFTKVSDYILQNSNNIGLVVVGWSGISRLDFETGYIEETDRNWKTIIPFSYTDMDVNRDMMSDDDHYDLFVQLHKFGAVTPDNDINNFFRYSVMLDVICSYFNVELVQFFSLRPIARNAHNNIKKFIENPFFDKVNHMNFYGWPVLSELGGTTIAAFRLDDPEKYCYPNGDTHPNELGHQRMMKELVTFIDDRGIL